MHLHRRSIRARIFVLVLLPLLALLGVYAFAAITTAGDAITLAQATAVRDSLADPIGFFTTELEGERILATTYLAAPTTRDLSALSAQEIRSDAALAELRTAADSASIESASPVVKADLNTMFQDAAGLQTLRGKIMSGAISREGAQSAYSQVIAAGFTTIDDAILQMPNVPLVNQSLVVMKIVSGENILLQSEALLVGDETAGHFPAADHAKFARLVGLYQGLLTDALPDLEPAYRTPFQRVVSSPALGALQTVENAVINSPAGALPRVRLASYDDAVRAVAGGLAVAGYQVGDTLASSLHQAAEPIDLRLILVGGLGLLSLIVSIVVSVWIGRGLVRELAVLRQGALELAHRRLPLVMSRLSAGDYVDVEAEAPPLATGSDEIGQVVQAFNSVQRSAIEAAVSQARMRAGISTIFRNLARRSQTLLYQQLTLLDDLELRATEPAELEGLFRIDHLTTRMRRHAEGLVVLAGDRAGRTWTEPVPLTHVLRGAVAEVVGYARIRVICTSRAALHGWVVADAIHLIAELAENATVFSPPHTPVRIVGSMVARGFAVEIEDRGLGMSEETMAALNARFLDPPQLELPESEQLGLYVAARLAHRHGIGIMLRSSPFGGTTAIVHIPSELIVAEGEDALSWTPGSADGQPDRAASTSIGRHASRVNGVEARVPRTPAGLAAGANEDGPNGGANGHSPNGGPKRQSMDAPPDPGSGSWELPDWMLGDGAGPRDQRPVQPERPGARDDNSSLTELELPRRIRQASLSPYLRESPFPGTAGGNAGSAAERSPDEIRDALSAMQRGWERGRRDDTQAAEPEPSSANGIPAPRYPENPAGTDWPDRPSQDSPPSAGGPA